MNNGESKSPAAANAHAVLASYWKLNWPTRRTADLANVVNNGASDSAAAANAYAVLATNCMLKWPTNSPDEFANAASK